ncbi:hypothetical protein [Amycolatopsis sp. Hca4]|uniref:hypothetical protein n=1 Tax=Amycolatopsis sp. Hca4 TaxID=2742131 RepID=UPI001592A50B|nr:hypothetical protein [Amycolatopsis sp. Hca4]QKV75291.1 hypothetical protein HUT10_17075 [Amycolatopsis sp. Hca4]
MLRYAISVQQDQSILPWPAETLFKLVFDVVRQRPSSARRLALDAIAMGRIDLVTACGIGPSEHDWLRLVEAARRADVGEVLTAAAALPPDRYRHKIGILAAFAGQLRTLPAAKSLDRQLVAFAEREPLARLLRRVLGGAPCTAREALADAATLANLFHLPDPLVRLATTEPAAVPLADTWLLGAKGKLALSHSGHPESGVLVPESDWATAPLSVVDDLVDAGLLDANQVTTSSRSAGDRVYLHARTEPRTLTDDEVDALEHHDESIRRALARGDVQAFERAPESAMGAHVRVLSALTSNRPDDVDPDLALGPYRETVRRLTESLRAVQDGTPAAAAVDAVLADRTTWQPLVNLFGTEALRSGTDGHRNSEFAHWLALTAARERLFLADWPGAIESARRCLTGASSEELRDEAQNLLACGLHNSGQHAAALQALEQAIEGEYSVALLANIGVVAAHLDRELAAKHLARVVREAPSARMRVNAALRALVLWQSDDSKIWEGEGKDTQQLPSTLREPLRSIVGAPIALEEFRQIAGVLARFDSAWLRNPRNLAGSPHHDTLEANFYRAVADEDRFTAMVGVFAQIADWGTAPDWLATERDSFITQTRGYLLDHIDDPDNAAGVIALDLARKVRGLPVTDEVVLALLGIATLTYHLTTQELEVGTTLVDTYHRVRGLADGVDEGVQAVVANLTELAGRRIAFNLHQARARELDARVEKYNMAINVLDHTPTGTPLWFSARREVAEVVDVCQLAHSQLTPWVRLAEDHDLRSMLVDFLDHVRETEFKARLVLGD